MKKLLILAVAATGFLVTGCVSIKIRPYSPYPVPVVSPDKTNSASLGLGVQNFLEYQRKINDNLDLVCGVSNYQEEDNSSSAIFLGMQLWCFNRKNSKFNISFPFGIQNIMTYYDNGKYFPQLGGEISIVPGFHLKHFMFSLYLRLGTGYGLEETGPKTNFYPYTYAGGGTQLMVKFKNFGIGSRFGLLIGGGSSSDAFLMTPPLEFNLFANWKF